MMSREDSLEVEVKFHVHDLPVVRERLLAAGATAVKPRVYERNVRFDTVDQDLLGRQELLRLRQDKGIILTFKGLSELDRHSEAKVREEIEVQVDNFDRMTAILERLGFFPQQTYEKYRETFNLNGLEIVLDEMPYGNFVEFEGPEVEMERTADQLQLNWQERIQSNYLAMMALLIERFDLPFNDLTFENFRDGDLSITAVLPLPD